VDSFHVSGKTPVAKKRKKCKKRNKKSVFEKLKLMMVSKKRNVGALKIIRNALAFILNEGHWQNPNYLVKGNKANVPFYNRKIALGVVRRF